MGGCAVWQPPESNAGASDDLPESSRRNSSARGLSEERQDAKDAEFEEYTGSTLRRRDGASGNFW